MEHLKLMLFPDTPLHTLLSIRPMIMNWLEKFGINPYSVPSARLEDLGQASGLRWDELLRALKALETPDRGSDWNDRPLYHLIDFLTHDHRIFLHEFLPAIRNSFAAGDRLPDFLGSMQPLIAAWPGFSASLTRHISDEETLLFPKIMRYEYCLRHEGTSPDFSEGSVRDFVTLQLMRAERIQDLAIQEFLDASHFSAPNEDLQETAAAGVYRLLQAFQHRLLEHSRMEREILFPLAGAMEKQVYDRFFEGQPVGGAPEVRGHGRMPLLP